MARMARAPKDDHDNGEGGGITGEYKRPDAKRALKIYTEEIAPKKAHMDTIKGDLSDPFKRIKDDCHTPRKMLELVVGLTDMEDAKRAHHLLALNLLLEAAGLEMPRDLVTMAEGKDGDPVIPTAARPKPKLVEPPVAHPTDDRDLAGDFTEATEEELAQQEGRGDPAPGTGAAARKAMAADPAKLN